MSNGLLVMYVFFALIIAGSLIYSNQNGRISISNKSNNGD